MYFRCSNVFHASSISIYGFCGILKETLQSTINILALFVLPKSLTHCAPVMSDGIQDVPWSKFVSDNRPAYWSVWSIRYVHRYILIDIRYIIWYFSCNCVKKNESMLSVYSYSKHFIIQWHEARIEYMAVKIVIVIKKSPYTLLNILIIFIDNSYNQTAFASFVIANVRNCDPSCWMCKPRSGGEMQFFCPVVWEIGNILCRRLLNRLIWTSSHCINGIFVCW